MASNRELVQENRELYEWIRDNGHSEFIRKSAECDSYTAGDQWAPDVKAKLARRRKPALTVNRVLATVAALGGEHLVRRGDIAFRAASGGDPETAQTLDKLWMNFTHIENYEWQEFLAFLDGVIRSRGFMDLRIDFDQAMQGEPSLTYMNSKDVGLYPGDNGMDPDKWTGVLLTRWLSPRTIANIYDVSLRDVINFADITEADPDYTDWKKDSFGDQIFEQSMGTDEQRAKYRLLRVMERQEWELRNVECFVDRPTGEVREIPDNWERERIQTAIMQFDYGLTRRKVRKINWVVSAGDLLLHNAISPYKHLTPIPYFPFTVGSKPVGIVEQLIDPQNLLNKTLSQELHILAGIANSGYKVRKGALSNMTPEQLQERGGEDGIVIELNQSMADLEKIQPNQVPTGLDRLFYTASESIQQISLVNDSMQGLNRADEAGKAIERKAAQGASALSPIYASLDQTRSIVARNWLDLVQQFVTEERAYHVTNRAKTSETQEVQVNQEQYDGSFINDLTVGEYAVHVTNIQARDTYDLGQFDIMMQAMRQGAPIPWSEIINSLTILENRDEIVQFLKQQEGRADPTEEQRKQAELDMRIAEAEASDKESSAAVKQAQAAKTQMETQQAGQPDPAEQMKAQQEAEKAARDAEIKERQAIMQMEIAMQKAQNDAQTAQAKLAFDQQKMQQELTQQRAKAEQEREKQQIELEMARRKMEQELEFMKEKFELERQKMYMDIAASTQQADIKTDQMRQKMDADEKKAEIQTKMMKEKKNDANAKTGTSGSTSKGNS